MRRSFKPMPADQIEDEDERCRVKHSVFVARQKHKPNRPSDFWFVVCILLFAAVVGGMFYLIFTHHPPTPS